MPNKNGRYAVEEDRYKHWDEPQREPNTEEKRTMIVEAIRVCLNFIVKNHLYTFGKKILRQKRGGPIGLDLTGTVSLIFMIWWDHELRARLEHVKLHLFMQKRYVDGIYVTVPLVEPGELYAYGNCVIEASREETRTDVQTMDFIK